MPTYQIDVFTYRKLEHVKHHLHGDGTTLTPDKRRDLANIMSDAMNQFEEIIDPPMTEEEMALAHEECKNGDGSNYSDVDWKVWLEGVRKGK
jgi:hypothetical protein